MLNVYWQHSLGISHSGVLSEGEVVGDVFVIWQPAVCSYQGIWTYSHLEEKRCHNMKRNKLFWMNA